MQPVSMTCPQCGAPLPRGAGWEIVECEHCGTRSGPGERDGPARVGRFPSPAETGETGRPLTFPVTSSPAYRWLIGLVPTLIAYVFYLFIWRQVQPSAATSRPPVAIERLSTQPGSNAPGSPLSRSTPPPSRPGPSRETSPRSRVLPGLLLVPSAHAGDAENLVAVMEEPGSRARWVGAFDGGTGDVLWRWPIERDPYLADAPRAVIDGMLLLASPGAVHALDLGTGRFAWSRDTGGRPGGLCRGDGFAGLLFADRRFVAFSAATGHSVKGRPDSCAEVLTSQSVAPNFDVVEGRALAPPLPAQAPLDVQRALVPHKGTARVLLGTDASGLGRVAVASRSEWLWSARLGRGGANRARLLSPPLAAVRNERVVVPYALSNPAELRLASLDLASGRLIWDEALATGDGAVPEPAAELRLSRGGTIYFANGKGQLWVVGLDSQPMWRQGE